MALFNGPRGKICRRLGFQAFESPKFAAPTKNYPPGQHGPTYRRRPSEYGLQLKEKQKMKYLYGVLEKQFRNYFKKSKLKKGITGQAFHHPMRSSSMETWGFQLKVNAVGPVLK